MFCITDILCYLKSRIDECGREVSKFLTIGYMTFVYIMYICKVNFTLAYCIMHTRFADYSTLARRTSLNKTKISRSLTCLSDKEHLKVHEKHYITIL